MGRGSEEGDEEGEGEGEEDKMMASASGGLGRRRFVVGCVGSTKVGTSSTRSPASSLFVLVSFSTSSRFCWDCPIGRWGRRDRGVENCGAGVACSFLPFWVELKLNLGVGANCWEEGIWVEACWKRSDEVGFGVGLAGLVGMNR